eukprot:g57681.t1
MRLNACQYENRPHLRHEYTSAICKYRGSRGSGGTVRAHVSSPSPTRRGKDPRHRMPNGYNNNSNKHNCNEEQEITITSGQYALYDPRLRRPSRL